MATKKNLPLRPAAPAFLSPRAQQLWQQVVEDYDLAPADLELLRQAVSALDRADEAAAILETTGLVTTDRYGGVRQHPMVDTELRNRALFARLLNQLQVSATRSNPVRRGRPAAGSTGRDPRLRVDVEAPVAVLAGRARPRLS